LYHTFSSRPLYKYNTKITPMPLSKFISPFLVILLCQITDAQRHLQEDSTNRLALPKRTTTVIATALVIVSCAPLVCVMSLYFIKVCQSRLSGGRRGSENNVDDLRSNIISNLLRQENGNFVLRRVVLEKFFSDVSKCLTAKDFPIKLPEFNLSPQFAREGSNMNEIGEGSETGNEGKSRKIDQSSLEVNLPNTPDTQASDDGFVCDEHEPEPDLSPVRASLFNYPKNVTNEKHGTPEMTSQECQIIDEEENKIHECNETDTLERGGPLKGENNECPICLEPYGEGDVVIPSKHCSHSFHKSCILSWLEQHQACPLCRVDMITEEEVKSTALSVVAPEQVCSAVDRYARLYGHFNV